jgi:hypothetical protein
MMVAFDRSQRTVSLAMPGYTNKMLTRFRPHYLNPSHRVTKSPGVYIPPNYGQTKHQLAQVDSSATLSPAQKLEIPGVLGTALSYVRAIEYGCKQNASQQANPILKVLQATNRLLSYCTAHRGNVLTYHVAIWHCIFTSTHRTDPDQHARPVARAIFFLGQWYVSTYQNQRYHTRNVVHHALRSGERCRSRIRRFSFLEFIFWAIFAGAQHGAYLSTAFNDIGYPQILSSSWPTTPLPSESPLTP